MYLRWSIVSTGHLLRFLMLQATNCTFACFISQQQDAVCSACVQRDLLCRYKKMFYFLWKFRRVEHTLTQSWRNLMSLSHISKKTAVAPELARAYTVRAEMANLVANFQYYIMFEVLASCWSQFNSAVKASVDLDGIVAAHEDYVRK